MEENMNTYETEYQKDKLLITIKVLCLMYLEDSQLINHIEDSRIIEYTNYIKKEYYEMNKFKNSLKIKTYYQPYYEIFSNLDSMILKDNLICKQEKVSFIELTKDVNQLEETLGFCFGILNLIIKTRNINLEN